VKQVGTNRETVRQYLLKRYTPKQKRAVVLRNFQQLKGQSSPNWKGGREVTKEGYICLWLSRKEKILEHRKIMEDYLGRKLKKFEVVHHINGNNADNRLSNLELTTYSEDIRRHQLARYKK
ncbi:MAG TPA: HNH endonuclease, partial [Candidatus Saccharimonadales bacterium]